MAQPIAHVLLYIVAFAATVRIVATLCSRFHWHGATKRQSHGESTTSLIVRGLVASLHKDKTRSAVSARSTDTHSLLYIVHPCSGRLGWLASVRTTVMHPASAFHAAHRCRVQIAVPRPGFPQSAAQACTPSLPTVCCCACV